ncbi:MAG: hypothetical protein AAF761_10715, partial [Pseudomonadota bacterium]
ENRTTALQQQLSRVNRKTCFKIFLTYSTPWWQSSGLYYGDAHTDLPLGQVIAFGTRGTRGGYSTLLAAFTFRHKELFEGLNHRGAARFENKVGDVDADLIPSRRLVDYVHKQLSEMFGVGRHRINGPALLYLLLERGVLDGEAHNDRRGDAFKTY